jgi:hypothetical protein
MNLCFSMEIPDVSAPLYLMFGRRVSTGRFLPPNEGKGGMFVIIRI